MGKALAYRRTDRWYKKRRGEWGGGEWGGGGLVGDYFEQVSEISEAVRMLDKRQAPVRMLDKRQAPVRMLDKRQAPVRMLDKRQAPVLKADIRLGGYTPPWRQD